jgi:hypothetical protein
LFRYFSDGYTSRGALPMPRESFGFRGVRSPGIDELIRTINRSKPMAEEFEDYVRLNQRIMSGEAGTYRPLDEVLDELRHLDQSPG